MRLKGWLGTLLLSSGGVAFAASSGCSAGAEGTSESFEPVSVTGGGVTGTLTLQSDWTQGYCADVVIANTGSTAITTWQAVVNLNQSSITSFWSATSAEAGTQLTVTPLSWNAALAPGASATFGFCGNATGSNYRPTLVSVSANGSTSSGGVDAGTAKDASVPDVSIPDAARLDASAADARSADAGGVDANAEAGELDSAAPKDSGTIADAASSPDSGNGSCFASGLNVAWVNFAGDVPTSSSTLATFKTIFANTFAAGGRVVRWWFHTNGTVTPGYDASGHALALSQADINGVKSILDAAFAAGVKVNISLWSFDMLQQGQEGIPSSTLTDNMNLLTVDANRQAYITNVLTPLVTALKGYHGLYSWEIFNEPEGMASDVPNAGWAAAKVQEKYIQRTVNWFASAIHDADPSALVTNAAWTFQACANVNGATNYYSDSALRSAGGMSNGTLDYYEVHYYADNGTQNSCYTNKASHWGLDKPIVMGEFYALATDGVAVDDLYTTLFNNGYHGAWAWEYTSSSGNTANTQWPAMQAPMQALYKAETSSVNCQ